ncbi:putative probable molybdopterin binding domain containing protein [Lyophyllum shimeji]|uniref:Probable molybdopterin binding domain containing protein n=1 Tax=Lyophyllum shimeji TaxID=47721 RepID=A0A9P3PQA9_LYOSH|nr:putative probable molybdopterin binding domain containing protein [Lyophyllum shimeji]
MAPSSSPSSSSSTTLNTVTVKHITTMSTHPEADAEAARFPISPIPTNPLGEGRHIHTAAALIIGDEILNGKTLDRNSHFFARYCFEHGIDLKRIEVVADDEHEIIEASRRMVDKYDLVITTGGIGPTHDDITYASLAKAFRQSLVHHPETLRRMDALSKHRKWTAHANAQQREAAMRMALFPEHAEVIFIGEDIWVPVIRLQGRLCVFPGIPSLFQRMLTGLTPFLPLPPKDQRPLRIQVFTERPESIIAPYLTSLQARLKEQGIQVGSYPVLGKGVFVSLIGRDLCGKDGNVLWLAEAAREVEREVGGRVVSDEEVAQKKEEGRESQVREAKLEAKI